MIAANVWIIFKRGVPMEVHLSEEKATKHRFHSETVQHFIRAETADKKDELHRQIATLSEALEAAQTRVRVLEDLVGGALAARAQARKLERAAESPSQGSPLTE